MILSPSSWRRTVYALTLVIAIGASAAPESADSVAPHRLADKAAVVPVKVTFEKNASAKTEGPYVMTLTNTSGEALKVKVRVDQDVTVHNRPKTRHVGPQEIAPGQDWKIDDLAALDKVTVTAHGFAPLQIVVQAKSE